EMDFLKYSVDRVVRSMAKDSVDAIPVYISKMPTIEIPNYVFENDGKGGFIKRTEEWGINKKGVSAGAAYADLDNDGDLDLVLNNSNDLASIYRNDQQQITQNHFLRFQLNGIPSNKRGIGAKVYVYFNGQLNLQEQSPVRGFQSSSDPTLVFGLGKSLTADSVTVIWQDQKFQTISNVKADQTVTFNQKDAKSKWEYKPVSNTVFKVTEVKGALHRENDFNDFSVQTLLPHYFSREGPCIAVGDVNKDGLDDFYQGGAKGQAGVLMVQLPTGVFSPKTNPAFSADANMEDVDASFIDVDVDGDVDLYVASGGSENNIGDPSLQDRLYINDGRGNFSKGQNNLPMMLSVKSCVRAADIDLDGDQDLFIGGRVSSGKYPTPPRSYMLINDGKGNFADQSEKYISSFMQSSMITDAAWVDINKDKYPDLITVGEWAPVSVYINSNDVFKEVTSSNVSLPGRGWWTKIEPADLDGDGDLDLVLGNYGENTQFKVNKKEPMTVTYKDFDGNGSIDPILCYYIKGVSFPAFSLDDMTEKLPYLKKKFFQYKDYSNATLSDVFTKEELEDAITLSAETMRTGYLENEGNGSFKWHDLPIEAQYAPVFGIAVGDYTGDGKNDILLGGNNTWTRIKFGRYTANHGILLKGIEGGNFSYVPQLQSGLKLRGNLRSLKAIKIGDKAALLAGINDGPTQLLTVVK
ncbi:MAG: FG-GAP-like repeat-containing protein, partial [Chitinophagaceae bacterium]